MDANITIGLPVYNGEKFIRESIESILEQTYQNWKMVISDNASTDGTFSICEQYEKQDPRVSVIKQETNIGIARNRNTLLRRADTPYFKWQDSDDVCAPTFLEECIKELEQDKDAVLAYSNVLSIDGNGNIHEGYNYGPDLWSDREDYSVPDPVLRAKRFIRHRSPAPAYLFGVMRLSAALNTRLMGSYMAADEVFLLELIYQGGFRRVDKVLSFIRNDGTNASALIVSRDLVGLQDRLDPRLSGRFNLLISRYRRYIENYIATLRSPLAPQQKAEMLGKCLEVSVQRMPELAKALAAGR